MVYLSEDKQTRHLVSFDPAIFEMSKIYQGNFFSPYDVWHSYFSIPRQSFYRKRAKSLEKNFFPALKMQLTFPEFHFETEAKVDFPSACI